MPAPTDYEIGSTLVGMTTLSVQSIPNPESDFQNYAVRNMQGNGVMRGSGAPIVTWHYGFLTSAQYDALVAYCTGGSAEAFIATPDNSQDFARYSCVMTMPERYQIRNGRYLDVEITFSELIEQP